MAISRCTSMGNCFSMRKIKDDKKHKKTTVYVDYRHATNVPCQIQPYLSGPNIIWKLQENKGLRHFLTVHACINK